MAPLEIHVTGDGTTYHPAECGILTLQARTKPLSTAQEADNMVASTMNALCDAIAPYCSYNASTGSTTVDAAIAHYSLTTFETTRGHERLQDGSSMSFSKSSRYETTYTASAQLTIEFRDFALLARLATQIGSMENVKIKSLEWSLTPSTLADVESQARKEATRKAIRKARDYAEGFGGLSDEEAVRKVKAVLVKEAVPYKKVTKAKLHFGKVNSEMTQKSEWDYEPKEVGIEVKVDGRFAVHE